MKSNICSYLISVFSLFISVTSYACGPYEFHPYGYYMYRVFDESSVHEVNERQSNCILWQELTSKDIPLKDIEQVVYKYTLNQMHELSAVQSDNMFAEWIKKDNEIYDFLVLAKMCENTRSLMLDPWYYPSKNDGTYLSLMDIEERAKTYDGEFLKDRYVLQAIRAMFSNKRYQECIDYWQSVEDNLPDGLIKSMSRSYIEGAYFKLGRMDDALAYFTEIGDLNSIIFCLRKQGKVKDVTSELKYIAEYAPDSETIPEYLQYIVSQFELWGSCEFSYTERMDTSFIYPIYREKFNEIYNLSVQMTKTSTYRNKAMWAYTAAYLADLDAKPHEAWKYIQIASENNTTGFLKESIRVMRMYLDAKVSIYDKAYEERLYADLKWLDGKIKDNITDKVREYASEPYGNRLRNNISFYYWNDMLRRILLAEVCPRMIDRGMPVRSLQLANMADNRLLNLVDLMEEKSLEEFRADNEYNGIDYCGTFFQTMFEVVTTDQLVSYINRIRFPKSDFDVFLNNRGFINYDYMYDIVGTKCIKELNYPEAIKYLNKVSCTYQSRLNTSDFMRRDPFSIDKKYIADTCDYKLRFATEMARLSVVIKNESDIQSKALAMIKYGTGIQNSVRFCWTLTNYKWSNYDDEHYEHIKGLLNIAMRTYDEALSLLNKQHLDESERELAAIGLVKLCQWKTAVETYPDTYAARYTKKMCDNLCDYSVDWLIN